MGNKKLVMVNFDGTETKPAKFKVSDGDSAYDAFLKIEGNENKTKTDFITYLKAQEVNDDNKLTLNSRLDEVDALMKFIIDNNRITLERKSGGGYYGTGAGTIVKRDGTLFNSNDYKNLFMLNGFIYGNSGFIRSPDPISYEVSSYPLTFEMTFGELIAPSVDDEGYYEFQLPYGVEEGTTQFNFLIKYRFKPRFVMDDVPPIESVTYGHVLKMIELSVTDLTDNSKHIIPARQQGIDMFAAWKEKNKPRFVSVSSGLLAIITSKPFDKEYHQHGYWNKMAPIVSNYATLPDTSGTMTILNDRAPVIYGDEYDFIVKKQTTEFKDLTIDNFTSAVTSNIKVVDYKGNPVENVWIRSKSMNTVTDPLYYATKGTDSDGIATIKHLVPSVPVFAPLDTPIVVRDGILLGKIESDIEFACKTAISIGKLSAKLVNKEDDGTEIYEITMQVDTTEALKPDLTGVELIVGANIQTIKSKVFNEPLTVTIKTRNNTSITITVYANYVRTTLTVFDLKDYLT